MKSNVTKHIYVIAFIVAIIYHISPVDVVSDIVPVIGQIDDVLVVLVPLIMGLKSISKK